MGMEKTRKVLLDSRHLLTHGNIYLVLSDLAREARDLDMKSLHL